MSNIHQLVFGWLGRRMDVRSGSRWAVRCPRRDWTVEALEGRALLSTYVVDRPGDAGTGSGDFGDLRYAIDQADQEAGDSTIVILPLLTGNTITLTSGPLDIRKRSGTLTIDGPGSGLLTISGGGKGEVFTVAAISTATISGLKITDGMGLDGGAIYNNGNLTLTGDTLTGNTAAGAGGAIDNDVYGTLTIDRSTISGNTVFEANGGGIANAGTLTIIDSTVSGNTARVANGGGIANAGTLTIIDSTVSGNGAGEFGGGLYNTGALTATDATVSDNRSENSGGGLDNEAFSGGMASLSNTIVADNLSVEDPGTDDVMDDGDFTNEQLVGAYDLILAGDLGALTNVIVGVDPRLGPLQNNGGPTQTQALLPGSPAINAGDNTLVLAGDTTDQRGPGYGRIAGGRVDIGAFEFQESLQNLGLVVPTGPPVVIVVIGIAQSGTTPVTPARTGDSVVGTLAPAATGGLGGLKQAAGR